MWFTNDIGTNVNKGFVGKETLAAVDGPELIIAVKGAFDNGEIFVEADRKMVDFVDIASWAMEIFNFIEERVGV